MLTKEQERISLKMQWTAAKEPWKYGVQLQILFDNYRNILIPYNTNINGDIFMPGCFDKSEDLLDSSKFDNNVILAKYNSPFAPGGFFNHKSKPEYFAEPVYIKPTVDFNFEIVTPKKLAVFGPSPLTQLAILLERLKRR